MNNKVSVVVSSCNKYHYLWDIQLQLFDRYWPDCPFNIYMISESSQLPKLKTSLNVINYNTNLPTTGPSDWSVSLIQLLSELESEYIIYLQEDYVFTNNVEVDKLDKLLNFVIDNQINYVRFYAAPPGNGDVLSIDHNLAIREILPESPWRSSLSLAIWKKDTLLSILKTVSGINPWQFEWHGGHGFDKFYCIDSETYGDLSNVFPWMGLYGSSNGFGIYPQAIEFLQKEGITKANGDPINYDIRL